MLKKKIIAVAAAALLGAGLGAYLSYGPLQRFKSEAELNIELSTADFKRFGELVNNPENLKQFVAHTKSSALSNDQLEIAIRDVKRGDWYKPAPRIAKTEYKEVPDQIIKLEQDAIRKKEQIIDVENETLFGKNANLIRNEFPAYTSLRITAIAAEPQRAADQTAWLSAYAQHTAITDAINSLVAKWNNENKLFSELYQVKKIQQQFETEQLTAKIVELKKSINKYSTTAKQEVEQHIEAGNDRGKMKSPIAQLIFAELDLMEIEFTNQKLNRAKDQQAVMEELIRQFETGSNKDKYGLERLVLMDETIVAAVKKTEIPAKREKLLLSMIDISNIKTRLVKKTQYVVPPTLPSRQDGPAPIKLMVLLAVLFASLVGIYFSRHVFFKYIKQSDNPLSIRV